MKFGNVEFNDELMEALRDGDLVIFAGAGVSIRSRQTCQALEFCCNA